MICTQPIKDVYFDGKQNSMLMYSSEQKDQNASFKVRKFIITNLIYHKKSYLSEFILDVMWNELKKLILFVQVAKKRL